MDSANRGAARAGSYQGQDQFVIEVLEGLRGGYFLDSGASNGTKGSNTRLLEEAYGWTGICIEPNDALYGELVRDRRCICLHCCLYDRDGVVEFLELAGVYGGILETYEDSHLKYVRRTLGDRWNPGMRAPTVPKTGRTLRSVLKEAKAPATIDYWSLDTEGSELAILKSFPFDEYRFRVLTVEHNRSAAREEIRRFLEGHGYARVRSLGIDDGYLWIGESPHNAWRSSAWGLRGRQRW